MARIVVEGSHALVRETRNVLFFVGDWVGQVERSEEDAARAHEGA